MNYWILSLLIAFSSTSAHASPAIVSPMEGLCVLESSFRHGRGVIADGKLITAAHNLVSSRGVAKSVKIWCVRNGKLEPIDLASPISVARVYQYFHKRFGPQSEAAIGYDVATAKIKEPFTTPFSVTTAAFDESKSKPFLVATLRYPESRAIRTEVHISKSLKKYSAFNGGPDFYMSDGFPEVGMGDSGSPLYVEENGKKILIGLVVARNEAPKSITFTDIKILRNRSVSCSSIIVNKGSRDEEAL